MMPNICLLRTSGKVLVFVLDTGILKEVILDDNKSAHVLCSCIIMDVGDSYTGDPF